MDRWTIRGRWLVIGLLAFIAVVVGIAAYVLFGHVSTAPVQSP